MSQLNALVQQRKLLQIHSLGFEMPRTTMNVLNNHLGIRVSRTWANGVLTNTNTDFPLVLKVNKVRTTVNTPGFRSLKKKWEGLPFNPFTYFEATTSYPYGSQHQFWPAPVYNNHWQNVGVLVAGIDFDITDPISDSQKASIETQALQTSLNALKGMKVNLGVAFGERKQTSNLLLSTASRIAGALTSLRKGNIKGVANALGITASTVANTLKDARRGDNRRGSQRLNVTRSLSREWLALQYGWKPLLSDVYNAAESLAAISGVRRTRISSSRTVTGYKASTVDWNHVDTRRVAQSRYTRKYIYVFSTSNEILKDLSKFGVTNPASVAWELLPWSFVLDWFIPIGDYIDVWDATLGLTFEKGCHTTFSKLRIKFSANGTKLIGTTLYDVIGGALYEKVRCDRVKLTAFPLPRLPDWTPHITFNRGVSTAALLRQRLKL